MPTMVEQQKQFMEATDQTADRNFNLDQKELYEKLIVEEYDELISSYSCTPSHRLEEPLENQLKEAADALAVTLGLIISMGVDPDKLFTLVSNNNMLKVTGEVVKDASGKVIKSQASIDAKEQLMSDIRGLLRQEED